MNQFESNFNERLKRYWNAPSEAERKRLVNDIFTYASENAFTFYNDIKNNLFNQEVLSVPLILEALAKDTDVFGEFYVNILNDILAAAKQATKPKEILTYLMEFCYVELEEKPFVQSIVDRLTQELETDSIDSILAVLWILPAFLNNKSIKGKSHILNRLQGKLDDNNWKIRVAAYTALKNENLLPDGFKLSLKDTLYKLIFGEPSII